MTDKNKKFYITTTLPYVNSNPHIGFALEIIQADVIARYKSSQGYDVFFNTGTDEHGLKIYQKALEEDLETQKFCDKYSDRFKKLKETLNLSYNSFIRTTDEHHIKAAQEFWKRCDVNGDIYKKVYKTKYCIGCELVKTDSELKKGRCPLHPNKDLEIIEEENYFFKFSKYQKVLLKFYKKNIDFIIPQSRYNEIVKFVEGGLNDFSISRLKKNLPWGVPVPGDEKQVMFVWFDALVNYISVLDWPEDEVKFKTFWPGMQIAGKDNLRQQTAMWQAMLMSVKLPNSTQVLIHGFITSDGQKMSKSLGNVIDPFELVEKYGTDAVRYFLLREIPFFKDGDFTYEKFEERYNSDLANGLGNLLSRILALAENKNITVNPDFFNKKEVNKKYNQAIEGFQFNIALEIIWDLISQYDKYIEKERPWELSDDQKLNSVLGNLFGGLEQISYLLKPFLPETSGKILQQIKTKKGKSLFPRI